MFPSNLSSNLMIEFDLLPLISFALAFIVPLPLIANNGFSTNDPAITPLLIADIVLITTLSLSYLILARPVSSLPNLLSTKLTLAT